MSTSELHTAEFLIEALRTALQYIDEDTCGAPPETIRELHKIVETFISDKRLISDSAPRP